MQATKQVLAAGMHHTEAIRLLEMKKKKNWRVMCRQGSLFQFCAVMSAADADRDKALQ